MFRKSSGIPQPGKDQGDAESQLEEAIRTITDIPKSCEQFVRILEDGYVRFQNLVSEQCRYHDASKKEIAGLLHLMHSYEGDPEHAQDLADVNIRLEIKLKGARENIETLRKASNAAFGLYQKTLHMISHGYQTNIVNIIQVPQLEAAIEQAQQRVEYWAGR